MRTIIKLEEPIELRNWKIVNKTTQNNLNYGGGGFPGEAVRKALLAEQFYLCAYTMKELKLPANCGNGLQTANHICHIEHFLPQARNIDAETIDFQNMFACFPSSSSRIACEYGAQAKKNYDPSTSNFVSPLNIGAEKHFKFNRDGIVEGVTLQGTEVVKILRLDHPLLNNDRAAVIKGRLEPKTGKPITAKAARRLAHDILCPDARGRLPAFCVAISQAAMDYAERAERRASRLKKKPT